MRQWLALILFALLAPAPAVAEDAMIVLDASGSMWGQIKGEAKIAIAKKVLNDVVAASPADRRLGLIAYGHRREGDCADIEQIAPVAAPRTAIQAAVSKISPKGKTPMTGSVRLAAEGLQYSKNKATVVLISDGIETCAPDPCAAAAALEKAGVDLTVHVVGFDVKEAHEQAQLRCIAENTGGQFFSAADSAQLTSALRKTVAEAAPVSTSANLSLRATELSGGYLIDKGLTWTVTPAAGGAPVAKRENVGSFDLTLPAGVYDVAVSRPSDGLKGEEKGVTLRADSGRTVTIALEFPLAATIRTEPVAQAVAGTTLKVHFTGPQRPNDFIALVAPDEPPGAYSTYVFVTRGNPALLRMPAKPGRYEARYVLGAPARVLAKAVVEATPATATLDAPASAIAGDVIKVAFTGPEPGPGDWVTVVNADDKPTKYNSYYYATKPSPAEIRMPLEPGDYELRYVQANEVVLARRPIRVLRADASLLAPETAIAGETVKVAFTGPPGRSSDWITVVKADDPPTKYNSYYYTSKPSPAEVRMPFEPGEYELRFIQGGSKVIATRKIIVTPATASLEAQASAIAGVTIKIGFKGPPPGPGDWVTVTKPDDRPEEHDKYYYATNPSPASVRMPFEAGVYELRYIQGGKHVLARRPIRIEPATATLDAPAAAKAGSIIKIGFTGPAPEADDWVTITRPDDPPTKYTSYHYVRRGGPAEIKAPIAPGAYEIRYVQGTKHILARRPITIAP